MLNQIYFANDTNWQSLIDAISNACGDMGATFDIVEIARNDFSWNSNAYAYYADIPTGINASDIIGVMTSVYDSVIGSSGSIYDNKIYIQLFSPYNSYKGDGNDDFICNLVVKNSSGGGIDFTGIIDALDDIYAGIGAVSGDLSNIYNAIGDIETQLTDVVINNAQWTQLINAISNINTIFTANKMVCTNNDGRLITSNIDYADFEKVFNIPIFNLTGTLFDVDVWKQGGQKHLEFNESVKSAISTGWQSVGITLAEEYRPRYQINRGYMVRQGADNIYVTIAIATTGVISINTTTALNVGTALRFAVDYV